jgi:hypothetical protein
VIRPIRERVWEDKKNKDNESGRREMGWRGDKIRDTIEEMGGGITEKRENPIVR